MEQRIQFEGSAFLGCMLQCDGLPAPGPVLKADTVLESFLSLFSGLFE